MAFDPCREWLGIDADELSDPRRVLGLPPFAGDAEAIVRAAEARLESLGRVSPGPFVKAHAALVRRVEEARDAMLGAAVSDATVAAAGEASPPASFPTIATGRGGSRRRRRSSGSGGLLLPVIAVLGLAAALLTFLVIRPDRSSGTTTSTRGANAASGREPAIQQPARQEPEVAEQARRRATEEQQRREHAAGIAAEQVRSDEAAAREREQSRSDETARMAAEQAQRDEAERAEKERANRASMTASLNELVTEAYQALRREDFATADRLLADTERQYGDDVEAATCLERWRLLAGYAREFTRFRSQAFAAANSGREYEVDGSLIAIVEINPAMFIYRQAGRNKRVARDEVDPRLEMAIVEAWFAADGRAANHLFLGAGWLCLDPPDVRRARGEWQIAGDGGEEVAPLMALLDDPAIRQVGR